MKDDILNAEEKMLNKIETQNKEDEFKKTQENKKAKIYVFIKYLFYSIILISSIIVMVYRWPYIYSLYKKPVVLRVGTYNTDALTDECLINIWKLMGNKDLKLKCPVSQKEYVIQGNNIYCPDPHLHGFSKIASENGKTPEVR